MVISVRDCQMFMIMDNGEQREFKVADAEIDVAYDPTDDGEQHSVRLCDSMEFECEMKVDPWILHRMLRNIPDLTNNRRKLYGGYMNRKRQIEKAKRLMAK